MLSLQRSLERQKRGSVAKADARAWLVNFLENAHARSELLAVMADCAQRRPLFLLFFLCECLSA